MLYGARVLGVAIIVAAYIPLAVHADTTAQKKAAFIKTVDESISGARLAGNPYKFVGKHVDLHCTVSGINDPSFFNAACGDDQVERAIVILHSSKQLEQGQEVRVLGPVESPQSGDVEGQGGSATFAVVKALYLE
jgi:hypothetical protein